MNTFGRADLHLHSIHSDGRHSPESLVRIALNRDVRTLALTDHDTISGFEEFEAACRKRGMDCLSGIELTASLGSKEVHILGYCFDTRSSVLTDYLEIAREIRHSRASEICDRLRREGVSLDISEVERQAGESVLGRPHIARAMIAGGMAGSDREAYQNFLSDARLGPLDAGWPGVREAVETLQESGGLAVAAHPGLYPDSTVLPSLIELGVDGVECVHPGHGRDMAFYCAELAMALELIRTGGSDFHGRSPLEEMFIGQYSIPVSWVKILRRRSAA